MARFQTVRRRARFQVVGYSHEAMQSIADPTNASVLSRIRRGETVQDAPAKPLKVPAGASEARRRNSYPERKKRKGLKDIRDWTFTGHTLRCAKVLSTSINRAVLGFLDATLPGRKKSAAGIAAIRNADERQYGLSPSDKRVLAGALHGATVKYKPVQAKRVS